MISKYNQYELGKLNRDEEELYCYFVTTECKLSKEEAIQELNNLKDLPYCSGMMKNIINKILYKDDLLKKFAICEDGSYRSVVICDRKYYNFVDVFVTIENKHYNISENIDGDIKVNIPCLMKMLESAETIFINCCSHDRVNEYINKNLK